MIDSTTSPVPVWKRYATMALLLVVLLGAAYFIYTKELHHGSSSSPSAGTGTVQPAPVVAPPTTVKVAPQGPIGGIPVNTSRNPFA